MQDYDTNSDLNNRVRQRQVVCSELPAWGLFDEKARRRVLPIIDEALDSLETHLRLGVPPLRERTLCEVPLEVTTSPVISWLATYAPEFHEAMLSQPLYRDILFRALNRFGPELSIDRSGLRIPQFEALRITLSAEEPTDPQHAARIAQLIFHDCAHANIGEGVPFEFQIRDLRQIADTAHHEEWLGSVRKNFYQSFYKNLPVGFAVQFPRSEATNLFIDSLDEGLRKLFPRDLSNSSLMRVTEQFDESQSERIIQHKEPPSSDDALAEIWYEQFEAHKIIHETVELTHSEEAYVQALLFGEANALFLSDVALPWHYGTEAFDEMLGELSIATTIKNLGINTLEEAKEYLTTLYLSGSLPDRTPPLEDIPEPTRTSLEVLVARAQTDAQYAKIRYQRWKELLVATDGLYGFFVQATLPKAIPLSQYRSQVEEVVDSLGVAPASHDPAQETLARWLGRATMRLLYDTRLDVSERIHKIRRNAPITESVQGHDGWIDTNYRNEIAKSLRSNSAHLRDIYRLNEWWKRIDSISLSGATVPQRWFRQIVMHFPDTESEVPVSLIDASLPFPNSTGHRARARAVIEHAIQTDTPLPPELSRKPGGEIFAEISNKLASYQQTIDRKRGYALPFITERTQREWAFFTLPLDEAIRPPAREFWFRNDKNDASRYAWRFPKKDEAQPSSTHKSPLEDFESHVRLQRLILPDLGWIRSSSLDSMTEAEKSDYNARVTRREAISIADAFVFTPREYFKRHGEWPTKTSKVLNDMFTSPTVAPLVQSPEDLVHLIEQCLTGQTPRQLFRFYDTSNTARQFLNYITTRFKLHHHSRVLHVGKGAHALSY